ncbi:MAG: TonB-dependent receptor [Bacteroidales bacterium]|nr:TonB-dependent receptor [Bacteroidales bacterium]
MVQLLKKGLAALAAIFAGVAAFAQVTTSSLAGRINDENGEPLAGAAVVAVHEPSGTQYAAVANGDGQYAINGMRVGGPYKVTISFLGYQTLEYTDVILQLAETYNLNATVNPDNEQLNSAVVMASPSSKFVVEKTGAATNINNSQIANLPTVTRSITDVTRLSPYGGNGTTFAGMDGRSSNFTVDGANFNNNFGLSAGLPGGGNPISIDAIEELQVVISPYDVRQTNFIGGGINAITKSGTNTLKGSAYVYHRNENLRGDSIEGDQIGGARDKDRNTTYGFTLGGPIIKNRLFFFVNFEQSKIPTVVNRWRGSENGVADPNNYISRTTLDDLKKVSDFVKNKYGYDTGSWTDFPADEDNTKVLARIDWNINNNHHLAVRYNYTLNNAWNEPNKTSMDGGTRMSGARMSQYSMSFANSMYAARNMVSTWSFDLNSRLTDNLSNQFLATYSKVQNPIRSSTSEEFPFIDILDDTQENNYMSLGYELFTWNNAVNEINYNIKDDLTYYAGAHKIMGGVNYEYQMANNQYMRNGSGYYRYKSVSDFLNGATPEIVCLTYGYDGEQKPAAEVRFHKLGIYAQDEWNATDRFKLTLGARVDGLFFDDGDLMTNEAIKALTYYPKAKNYQETHIDTGQWPTSAITVSPRIGFTWDVRGDKSLKVRGGTGFFSGRLPLVFFTNMPTNGGLVQYQAQINAKNAAAKGFSMDTFAGGLVTDSNGKATVDALYNKLISLGYPSTVSPKDGTVPSSISAVDPDFKMPQIWKTSLAVDYSFPTAFPMSITAEGIFNKTINGVSISDWSMNNVGGFARFNGADNRPIYPSGFRNNTKAFVLENTNRGYGWTGNVTFNMRPAEGVNFMAAYTHTVSKEVTGMPGSAAESAFTYVPTSEGPNYIKLHNSQYVTPDRVVASLDLHDKSGNHFDFIYETWRGGYKESYMLTNDMNGDGYAYDALYIPTDEEVSSNQFRFINADSRDRFMDYVHKDKYMSKNQGRYAEPYTVYSPWVHRIDFSYKHDFTVKVGSTKNTLQLCFDLRNALNLFNSSWGVSKYLNPSIGSEARILKYEGVDADGFATFSTPEAISGSTKTFVPFHDLGQCWSASIGIKYLFN